MFTVRLAAPDDLAELVAIDDDAARLVADAGLDVELAPDHPFSADEQARWRRSVELGRTFVAVDAAGGPAAGFAALDLLDGAPYLDQLSVRVAHMRKGLGRALLARAIAWGREHGPALWLTTYGHLPFNRPFYEREGFVVVPEREWGPEIARHIEEQRHALPAPEQRVVMRRGRAAAETSDPTSSK